MCPGLQDQLPKFDPSKKSRFSSQWVNNYQDRYDMDLVYVVELTKRKLMFLNDCIKIHESFENQTYFLENVLKFTVKNV